MGRWTNFQNGKLIPHDKRAEASDFAGRSARVRMNSILVGAQMEHRKESTFVGLFFLGQETGNETGDIQLWEANASQLNLSRDLLCKNNLRPTQRLESLI